MTELSLKNPVNKSDHSGYTELKKIFEKSLAVNKTLRKGHVISQDDLETKKPSGYGIPAAQYKTIIGKKLACDLNAYDFLTYEDLVS
jgi:N,N'-diacetyllegionaminate synthase